MASQNLPFSGPTTTNDLGIYEANPGVQYGGTETNALYYEHREVAGVFYRVQNATYNAYASKWLLVNPALPAYALATTASGTTQFLTSPANTSPFTSWTVVWSVDKNGNASFASVAGTLPAGSVTAAMLAAGAASANLTNGNAGVVFAASAPYNPDPTYTNDASAAIQSALNATPAGGLCFLGPGTYKIGTTLTVPSGITFAGAPGTTLKGAANPIVSCANVQGNAVGTTPTRLDGLRIVTTSNNDGLHFASSYFAPAAIGVPATLRNLAFDGSLSTSGTLCALTGGEGWYISGCSFSGSSGAGASQATGLSFSGCSNFSVTGCTFRFLNPAFTASSSGSNVSQGVLMTGCVMNGCYRSIVTSGCDSMTYSACMIDNTGTVITSTDDMACTLTDSYCGSQQSGTAAIIISNSTSGSNAGWFITNNRIYLYVTGGYGISITGNSTTHINGGFITGNRFDSHQPTNWVNGNYIGGWHIEGNSFMVLANPGPQVLLANSTSAGNVVRENVNYNPIGFISPPSVPASGTAQANIYYYDVDVYLTANGATISGVSVNGSATGLTSGWFRLGIGETIAITYSGGTPAWQWKGN